MRWKRTLVIGMTSLILIGCGESSNTTSTTTDSPTSPQVQADIGKAYYVDSGVDGIDYVCGDNLTKGVTSKGGELRVAIGHSCKLYLNNIVIKSFTPLFDGMKVVEQNVTVARFLQSLDADGDASNGITILEEVKSELGDTLPTTDSEVQELVSKLKTTVSNYSGTFISIEEAQQHLDTTIQNNKPVAYDIDIAVNEDSSTQIEFNATDPQNDELTYAITQEPTNGTITIEKGVVQYTPNANFNGTDNFKYKANDGSLDSNEATVNITVNPVNDAPVANDDSASLSMRMRASQLMF